MVTHQDTARALNRFVVPSLWIVRTDLLRALCALIVVLIGTVWTGTGMGASVDRLTILSASASADDGNSPANTLDGSQATRWSATGDGQWISYDLGSPRSVGSLRIAWYKGNQRAARFDVQTSESGTSWITVFSGQSSGTTTDFEAYDLTASSGQYVRLVGHGNSQDQWNSITEVEFYTSAARQEPNGSDGFDLQIGRSAGPPAGPMMVLNWNGAAGAISQMQVSSDLLTWADLGAAVTNTGTGQTWQEDVSGPPASAWPVRFYRVKQNSAPAPGNTNPPPPTPIGGLPSALLNLTNWKLTLPVDTARAGSPDEILQPELNGFQDADYFHLNGAGNAVVFMAPCGGATTSGSGYPRSELREMSGDGSALASWSTTSGTHTMEITQAITHLPDVKRHMVAGQIHDSGDDVIVIRLEDSKLFIDQNGVNGPVLSGNYQLGEVFTVKFVAQNGGVECYYNGQYIYTYKVSNSGCYFKAGCYTQSNTSKGDAPTAYGEVVIYALSITHQ